ncbi:MAG: FemAB family PEP-CTERM system-associated protein [Gemmatimonadales bacterium]|nr:FemAB family PEP-CTERM system-associated protein [Gemmatimonadales bacterium]
MTQAAPYEGTASEWDAFAARYRGYTHFHRYAWKSVIEETFGHQCLYLSVRDGSGALAGVLPLVRVKSLLFGHYLVSLPFVNYGGPLGEPDAVRDLVASAVEEAARSGAKLLELRSRVELPVDLAVSHRKITVVLDLPSDADALFKSFTSKLRSQVRRPMKDGVTMRFGADQVGPFFDVFSRHMRDLGTPTLPHRFFEAIARAFPTDATFGCAWHDGRPVACGAGFSWGTEFEMTWASSLVEFNKLSPNMLVYWEFMQRVVAQGGGVFNFGRCTPDSGTHRFKRQWGSRDEPLWWYQRTAQGVGEAATPSPDQGKYRWGPRLWKHLPLAASRWLGPRIVRLIP